MHRLRIRRDRRVRPPERDGRDRPADIVRGEHRVDARDRQRRARVDRDDAPMGDGTAHDRRVPLPGAREIVDELPAPAQEAQILDPFDRAADESIDVSHGIAVRYPSPSHGRCRAPCRT